jgi:hypothetical protein
MKCHAIDLATDARIDAYHAGWLAHSNGLPIPADTDGADGWSDHAHSLRVVVVMPQRAEGYYHTNPNGDA